MISSLSSISSSSLSGTGEDSSLPSRRLLVISSRIENASILDAARSEGTEILLYEWEETPLSSLLQQIQQRSGGQPWESIGFVHHGRAGHFSPVEGEELSLQSLSRLKQRQFWQGIASLVEEEGRIDLLACSLAASDEGRELLVQLEEEIGRNIAASDDRTGSQRRGGDWILESDAVAVDSLYFVPEKLTQWQHVLQAPEPHIYIDPFQSLDLSEEERISLLGQAQTLSSGSSWQLTGGTGEESSSVRIESGESYGDPALPTRAIVASFTFDLSTFPEGLEGSARRFSFGNSQGESWLERLSLQMDPDRLTLSGRNGVGELVGDFSLTDLSLLEGREELPFRLEIHPIEDSSDATVALYLEGESTALMEGTLHDAELGSQLTYQWEASHLPYLTSPVQIDLNEDSGRITLEEDAREVGEESWELSSGRLSEAGTIEIASGEAFGDLTQRVHGLESSFTLSLSSPQTALYQNAMLFTLAGREGEEWPDKLSLAFDESGLTLTTHEGAGELEGETFYADPALMSQEGQVPLFLSVQPIEDSSDATLSISLGTSENVVLENTLRNANLGSELVQRFEASTPEHLVVDTTDGDLSSLQLSRGASKTGEEIQLTPAQTNKEGVAIVKDNSLLSEHGLNELSVKFDASIGGGNQGGGFSVNLGTESTANHVIQGGYGKVIASGTSQHTTQASALHVPHEAFKYTFQPARNNGLYEVDASAGSAGGSHDDIAATAWYKIDVKRGERFEADVRIGMVMDGSNPGVSATLYDSSGSAIDSGSDSRSGWSPPAGMEHLTWYGGASVKLTQSYVPYDGVYYIKASKSGGSGPGISVKRTSSDVPIDFLERGTLNGLALSFDTYGDYASDVTGLSLRYNGTVKAQVPLSSLDLRNREEDLPVEWKVRALNEDSPPDVAVTVLLDGQPVLEEIVIEDFTLPQGWKYWFGARTGARSDRHAISDLQITEVPREPLSYSQTISNLQMEQILEGLPYEQNLSIEEISQRFEELVYPPTLVASQLQTLPDQSIGLLLSDFVIEDADGPAFDPEQYLGKYTIELETDSLQGATLEQFDGTEWIPLSGKVTLHSRDLQAVSRENSNLRFVPKLSELESLGRAGGNSLSVQSTLNFSVWEEADAFYAEQLYDDPRAIFSSSEISLTIAEPEGVQFVSSPPIIPLGLDENGPLLYPLSSAHLQTQHPHYTPSSISYQIEAQPGWKVLERVVKEGEYRYLPATELTQRQIDLGEIFLSYDTPSDPLVLEKLSDPSTLHSAFTWSAHFPDGTRLVKRMQQAYLKSDAENPPISSTDLFAWLTPSFDGYVYDLDRSFANTLEKKRKEVTRLLFALWNDYQKTTVEKDRADGSPILDEGFMKLPLSFLREKLASLLEIDQEGGEEAFLNSHLAQEEDFLSLFALYRDPLLDNLDQPNGRLHYYFPQQAGIEGREDPNALFSQIEESLRFNLKFLREVGQIAVRKRPAISAIAQQVALDSVSEVQQTIRAKYRSMQQTEEIQEMINLFIEMIGKPVNFTYHPHTGEYEVPLVHQEISNEETASLLQGVRSQTRDFLEDLMGDLVEEQFDYTNWEIYFNSIVLPAAVQAGQSATAAAAALAAAKASYLAELEDQKAIVQEEVEEFIDNMDDILNSFTIEADRDEQLREIQEKVETELRKGEKEIDETLADMERQVQPKWDDIITKITTFGLDAAWDATMGQSESEAFDEVMDQVRDAFGEGFEQVPGFFFPLYREKLYPLMTHLFLPEASEWVDEDKRDFRLLRSFYGLKPSSLVDLTTDFEEWIPQWVSEEHSLFDSMEYDSQVARGRFSSFRASFERDFSTPLSFHFGHHDQSNRMEPLEKGLSLQFSLQSGLSLFLNGEPLHPLAGQSSEFFFPSGERTASIQLQQVEEDLHLLRIKVGEQQFEWPISDLQIESNWSYGWGSLQEEASLRNLKLWEYSPTRGEADILDSELLLDDFETDYTESRMHRNIQHFEKLRREFATEDPSISRLLSDLSSRLRAFDSWMLSDPSGWELSEGQQELLKSHRGRAVHRDFKIAKDLDQRYPIVDDQDNPENGFPLFHSVPERKEILLEQYTRIHRFLEHFYRQLDKGTTLHQGILSESGSPFEQAILYPKNEEGVYQIGNISLPAHLSLHKGERVFFYLSPPPNTPIDENTPIYQATLQEEILPSSENSMVSGLFTLYPTLSMTQGEQIFPVYDKHPGVAEDLLQESADFLSSLNETTQQDLKRALFLHQQSVNLFQSLSRKVRNMLSSVARKL